MMKYTLAYCLGFTPWERYGMAAAESIGALLDREEAERLRPLGRAIDLGCGRGRYTAELARRGWEAVGIDNIPRAIDAANRSGVSGATFVVGDVTKLAAADLGRFDFFLDVGCFQGLSSGQRLAEGQCVPALEPLAKYYEHVQSDYPTALSLARQLQALEPTNTVHFQRVRRLVAKMHVRERQYGQNNQP